MMKKSIKNLVFVALAVVYFKLIQVDLLSVKGMFVLVPLAIILLVQLYKLCKSRVEDYLK